MQSRKFYFFKKALICILLLVGMVGCATSIAPRKSGNGFEKTEIAFETAAIDRLGHLYYANQQNRITKLNDAGDSVAYYANNSYGKISIIDATNPLKVLVYYPDFYAVVVLDRQLNETQQFNLLDLGYGEIRIIASSIDGAMWIFNDHEQRLIKATQQGHVLQRGEDLRLRFKERLTPTKIIQAGDELYIQVPERGLLIFDLFGQFKTQILDPEIQDFQIYGKKILIRQTNNIAMYDPQMPGADVQFLGISVNTNEKVLLSKRVLIRINPQGILRENFDYF